MKRNQTRQLAGWCAGKSAQWGRGKRLLLAKRQGESEVGVRFEAVGREGPRNRVSKFFAKNFFDRIHS